MKNYFGIRKLIIISFVGILILFSLSPLAQASLSLANQFISLTMDSGQTRNPLEIKNSSGAPFFTITPNFTLIINKSDGNIGLQLESGSGFEDANYIVFSDGGNIYAKNGTTGAIVANGTNASNVIQGILFNLTKDRTWKERVVLRGNFTLTTPLNISNYTILDIQGILFATPNMGSGNSLIQLNNVTDVEIINGVINGTRRDQTNNNHGILITANSTRIKVQNVLLLDIGLYGIYTYDSSDVDILYNRLINIGGHGIVGEGAGYNAINVNAIGNSIDTTGLAGSNGNQNGIHYESGGTTGKLASGHISNNYLIRINKTGIVLSKANRTQVIGNTVIGGGQEGIVLIAVENGIVSKNILDNNDGDANGGYQNGIRIDDGGQASGSKYNLIDGNIIFNHSGQAIVEKGNANFTIIVNNIVYNNGNPLIATVGNLTKVFNNPGYNPVGQSSITVGSSPFTYTASASTENIYISGGVVTVIAKIGTTIFQNTNHTVRLQPNETMTVTYSSAPTMIKDVD
ncbi:TPA: right-handed parallel beta-helix repeat-containing protein [archaeon]|nr:right-handed parallel beta-helix repeat-containing protein [Candidatus Naiadarchaeales archaeon SRR2090153.bin461]HIK02942.1 right-handed parallel beta-helix repeat-containing protein [Candidatus Naiadarchaeales archaeon SRR2090159.bin1288]